ncbi:MAG: methionine adenosyltransferase [Bacteroidia bacterium]|nr:methionine adenosyltransferase [Bacteroidia bacterium]
MSKEKTFLFTSESVSEGHPDKVADQISDALLDAYLSIDPDSRVAIETLVTTDTVILAGEVGSTTRVDHEAIARKVICGIGYDHPGIGFDGNTCKITNLIHEQSHDIADAVLRPDPENQGAGDQGLMFGYACTGTETLIPLPIYLSHRLMHLLADIRREGREMTYLRPDAKSQVTILYDDQNNPLWIDTILVSTQHDDFKGIERPDLLIKDDIARVLIPRLLDTLPEAVRCLYTSSSKLLVNPSGKFVIGGPNGDTGLTGRKIIVDTYGGWARHGGGAFSGKDPSKVDRSGAYAARYIAKNLVAAGLSAEVEVQLAYAIGQADPVSVSVNTFGKEQTSLSAKGLEQLVRENFPLRPYHIIRDLALKNPIYQPTAAYGHMGRKSYSANGIKFFPWEETNKAHSLRS